MDKTEAKKRIEKLKEAINRHRYLYHVLDQQEISDAALDSLKHELSGLEKEFPEFITPDSPTQRVGGEVLKGFKKVSHKARMLSIEDVFSEKEIQDWEEYLKRLIQNQFSQEKKFEYFAEYKIDGFAISLIYRQGKLKTGATRGNGILGEDVTQNLKTIESLPLSLFWYGKEFSSETEKKIKEKIKTGEIEIRGEVFMEKKDFERFNQELEKKGEKTYSNPRNLAAGSIRQLDSKLAASRPLKFLAYDIVTDLGQKNHSEEHKILPALGFKTGPGKVCKKISEIIDFWQETEKKREKLPYQIDGIVINVNSNSLFQSLGVAGKSPRGSRALKFSPKQATTKILDIKVHIGRTGAATPIAQLKPIQLGGVNISKATLHNEDEIKRLGLKIGDTVIVERAGDVIPAVSEVLKDLRSGKEKAFIFPSKCPVCLAQLKKIEGEAIWRCQNPVCQAKKREGLYHFVSKKAFDIAGLGPQIVNQLMDEGLISDATDIFTLKEGDLIPLERFESKSSKNLIEAIENSKKIPLSRFIFSLGIFHVGEETANDLADYFGSTERIGKATVEELKAIPDVGEKVAESIFNWFTNKENQKFIEKLLLQGVKIVSPPKKEKKLQGRKFVLTGSLNEITRSEAEKKIRLLGGSPASSVSEKTDYLVAGKEPGSKLEKARKLGVKIIGEEEFLRIIKE